jgi:hypothetical protein
MTNEAVVAEPVPGLTQVERVVDTFLAPSKTFTDILRSANWIVPFVILIALSYAVTFALGKQVGFDRIAENQVAASPKAQEQMAELTPEARAQRMKISVAATKYVSYAYPVFILGAGALIALVLWASFNFGLGAQTKFGQVLAVWMYASLPKVLASVLMIVTLFVGNNQESFDVNHPVGTNLGYYMTDSANWLRTLLTWFDLFGLWSLALLVIGMAVIAKKSIAQSTAVVVGWWLICLLFAVGFATMS